MPPRRGSTLLAWTLLAALGAAAPRSASNPAADLDPPRARIVFPLHSALTDRALLVVRGTARDASGVAAVRVNGVAAVSADGFLTWFATVPLHVGANTLVVATQDVLGHVDPVAATSVVRRDEVFLHYPSQIAFDPASGRCFVSDMLVPVKILEVDLVAASARVLSAGGVGSGPKFVATTGMALDPTAARLLVNEIVQDSLLAVDLASGDRTVVSGPGVGSGPGLVLPDGLALDPAGGRAWVLDDGTETLVEIDLASGDRRVVSGPTVGGGPPLDYGWSLDVLAGGNRALVSAPWDEALLAVDLASGERRLVSSLSVGSGVMWERPFGIVARAGRGAYVSDALRGTLFAVDLATGNRREVSGPDHPLGAPGNLEGLALDPAAGRALVVDRGWGAILDVDLGSGSTVVAFRTGIGSGPGLRQLNAIVLDPLQPGRALTTSNQLDAVLAVDLRSGARSVLSGAGAGTGPQLVGPIDLAIDDHASPPRLLVLDDQSNALVAVDLASGDRTIVSGPTVGLGGAFSAPQGVVLDPDPLRRRALVLDTYDGELVAVDLVTGDRTTLSGVGVGLGPTLFPSYDLDYDAGLDRVLAINLLESTLVAVDLASGNRTLLSGQGLGQGPVFQSPLEIVWHAAAGRALVSDYGRLIAVDPLTGDRTQLAAHEPRKGPGWGPTGLALHAPAAGLPPVLLCADSFDALSVMDLTPHPTSPALELQRTIVSR